LQSYELPVDTNPKTESVPEYKKEPYFEEEKSEKVEEVKVRRPPI